ncbi:MAG: LysM peptidoglycan-binding domain-containing protein [Firmicutes bacterium]|nr:LysM peptidoglycan-binding domain-containing protein [Bacillota bacterium]
MISRSLLLVAAFVVFISVLSAGSVQALELTTYVVRPGDSYYLIGLRYGISAEDLQKINSARMSYLEVGQVIKVPATESSFQPSEVTSGTQVYTVRPGDSLFLIARRFNTTVGALQRANNLSGIFLAVGQKLVIPSSSFSGETADGKVVYQVQPGDSLYLIARRFGITIADLRQANDLWSDYIYVGQKLVIPTGNDGTVPASTTPGTNTLTAAERDLLARLVTAEAGGEPYEGQVAVAATVLARVRDPRYPNNVRDVIYQQWNGIYQYEPVLNGYINNPAIPSAYRAVDDALAGIDPSNGANGFYNPKTAVGSWVRSQPVTAVIGNHVFFRS